jgi:hypothetical protein
MEAYGRVDLWLHSFLTIALDTGERLVVPRVLFTSGERTRAVPFKQEDGPRANVDVSKSDMPESVVQELQA